LSFLQFELRVRHSGLQSNASKQESKLSSSILLSNCSFLGPLSSNIDTPHVLSPFRGGGIKYLNDPDTYAGWSLYTPVRAIQAREIEG